MKHGSLTRLIGLLLALVSPLSCAAADEPLRLKVSEHTDVHHEFTGKAKSYGVTVSNFNDDAVTIERGISIEKRTAKGWLQDSGIQAVADCIDIDTRYRWKAPILIEGHRSLDVVPWDGFLCGGQCDEACKQNVQVRHGIYRFVIVMVPDGKRIASPPFAIP